MMASACVNNVGMSLEPAAFPLPASCPAYGWLSPRISFSRDSTDGPPLGSSTPAKEKNPDPESLGKDPPDFEFRLDDPVAMLPADELIFDGKLVPLQLAATKPSAPAEEVRSPEAARPKTASSPVAEIAGSEYQAQSPKAPRCSSRWRELLGLRKQQSSRSEALKPSSALNPASITSKNRNPRSLRHFLHRHAKSAGCDASLSLPLLRDSDSECVSISSSRLSLSSSSSSSGPDHDELLPRLSLDSEKPSQSQIPPRVRVSRQRSSVSREAPARIGRSPFRRPPEAAVPRGASVDSPRMNASGKVVFQGLERSSSSPSTFNGGTRIKYRGMERSYSANVVRVTPVLNVPVCSLRGSSKSGSVFGFGQLFSSPQKKDKEGSSHSTTRGGGGGSSGGGSRGGKMEREKA